MSNETFLYRQYLCQVYQQAYIDRYVSFSAFESAPEDWLLMLGQYDAVVIMQSGFRPLLPAQIRLRQQPEAQWIKEGSWDESLRLTHSDGSNTPSGSAYREA
jgi:hypothetical protein